MYTSEDMLYRRHALIDHKSSECPYNFAIIFDNLFTYYKFQIARRILQPYPNFFLTPCNTVHPQKRAQESLKNS